MINRQHLALVTGRDVAWDVALALLIAGPLLALATPFAVLQAMVVVELLFRLGVR